ncbi:uncharacterized protein SPAPADRAFT_63651 [Spathaspora passalidarum NRRL Y-27907]|uniref:Uncharacterized protein n=1 Tax=Spathaspora passalidarum (strain NRRL Y-27907 / 11-Y1) TaxID=619300 RepID=G3AUU0_SPAPN|nr:uncharacterized protein SPAPADRAFT_63651 [Spathaspora passalidarum NRRL Y-27907]EGW30031.1 hypothetical protein SPAPADRAFT_63651 [Spathaspora passalidarum NRRL Y-27907]
MVYFVKLNVGLSIISISVRIGMDIPFVWTIFPGPQNLEDFLPLPGFLGYSQVYFGA